MPSAKLSRRGLAAIEPADRRIIYYDEALSGFALRVEPTGRMTWFVEYRPGAGGRGVQKKRLTIGPTTQFTPDEARDQAKTFLARVRLGEDPAAERNSERAVPTMKEFANRYLDEEAETKLKPASVRNYRSYIGRHIIPALGSQKLDKIGADEIARMHRKVGKTSPVTANRLVETVGSIYRYAATCGLVPKGTNPGVGVTAFRETSRERFLSDAELARLGQTLVLADTKSGRRHAVLNAPALAILRDLDRFGDFVISGSGRDKPRADLNRPWRAIRAHAGLNDVRIHDLRHTNASVAASGGVPLAIVGKLLGHSQPGTTQRYAHLADDPVRAAADTVGNRISAAMSGNQAEIKPLRRGGNDVA